MMAGALIAGALAIAAGVASAQDHGAEAHVLEGDPIDDAMRAEQQRAGWVGLGIWTVLALGIGVGLGLRVKPPRG